MTRFCIAVTLTLSLTLASCRNEEKQIPAGSFKVQVETLVETKDVLVKHLRIEAPGKREVRLVKKDSRSKAVISPGQNQPNMHADIACVAVLIRSPNSQGTLKLLMQIKGQGVTVGGPSSGPVDADKVDDILQLKVDQDYYDLGDEIEIGSFQGDPIKLTVE